MVLDPWIPGLSVRTQPVTMYALESPRWVRVATSFLTRSFPENARRAHQLSCSEPMPLFNVFFHVFGLGGHRQSQYCLHEICRMENAPNTWKMCCVSTFFENLFLGALLAFLCQFGWEQEKKNEHHERSSSSQQTLRVCGTHPKCLRRGRGTYVDLFNFERLLFLQNVVWRKEGGEEGQNQELNNRMCSHNLD